MKHLIAGALALMISTVAVAKEKAPPPTEPASKPDFAKVRESGESGLKSTLFDPSSAQINYTSGFQWGYWKPIIFGRRTYGWIACGMLNAKNRMGGYVGATGFWIMADANGAVTFQMSSENMSTCDNGQKAELQPELQDKAVAISEGNARLGIAEELAKLADLKAKGIITQAEFDAQKAKLLAP